jgi:two-component system, cell cycle sensor histidine kinase and response regulator CckA
MLRKEAKMTRVLIVDDRGESRYYLQTLLRGHGYEVESACHGAEALDIAMQNPPQLVISDLLMPVMDGYTLLHRWKDEARLREIPFVVYTATYTDPRDEQLALSLGARAFILKPTEPSEFVARIRQILDDQGASPATVPRAPLLDAPAHIPVAAPEEEAARSLQQYNEVLIHKLEDKMEQADKAKRELERELIERRQMEEAHARLVTAVEQAAEAIVITDVCGTILYVNPAFEKITGYARAEAVGRNPHFLKSGKHDQAFYQQMWNSLLQGKAWSGRIVNRKKDGALIEEEMTISPIRDSAGKVFNYVAVKRDVTQEVALETQLRQAQKMEAIGLLAGGLAHDFNNILTVIHGNASLLLNTQLDATERAECSDQILRASERAASLTRQLLMFSRKQVMQPASLDLNQVVQSMVKMLRRILGEDITLQSVLEPNLPPVFADASMMEQVLLNLAVNSRDAMPSGGTLTITTGIQVLNAEQARPPSPAGPGEYVWLAVKDTGCGISAEVKPLIFEPFFTTKAAGKGSGLGLSTVYGIVQQHRGWIDVDSDAGQGAAFRVYLPAARGARIEHKSSATSIQLPTGNETILAVEDDPSLRLLIRRILERCGYTVLSAATGAAAVQVWSANKDRIQLLLTDLVMPEGMSGFDLAWRLLADKPGLKVIYTSGYRFRLDEGTPLIEGENYLQKPYSSENLAQTVRHCLEQASP